MRKPQHQGLIATALLVAWMIITLWAPASWLKSLSSSLFLLLVPGWLILRSFVQSHRLSHFWSVLSYTVAFSLLYLMLIGLAASTILPFFGIQQPLTLVPLTGLISTTLALLVSQLTARGIDPLPALPRPKLSRGTWSLIAAGAALPVLAATGAVTLNNGGSSLLAATTLGLTALYALILMWPNKPRAHSLYPYALFVIALTLLLGNSLRGWYITGHDIIQEYQVFQLTSNHGIWSMSFLHDAYNACLSITILPTIITKLSGIRDVYVYKLLVQLIFALVPPVLYLTLSRYMTKPAALLAGFVFISFPTFITDMSMLNRQEIAFLFFALMLLTLQEIQLTRRTKSILLLILGLGMILSHYSTSYVALGIILTAKVFELVVERWQRWRHRSLRREFAGSISWAVTLALLLTVYFWNTQVTATSQSIAKTIGGIATNLPKIINHSSQVGEAKYSLVKGSLSNDELFRQYAANTTIGRDQSASAYYPDTLTSKYPVQSAKEQVESPTAIGQALAKLHIPLYSLYDAIRADYAKLIQVLLVIGLVALTFRPQLAKLPRQYVILGFASLFMIALQVLLPAGVIDYGLLRLIQQSLMFLAPAIVLACYLLFTLLRFKPVWRLRATALLLLGFFVVNTGFLPSLTGGYKPALATSNSGFYYEAYYTHATEIAGYTWLGNHAPLGSIVNADEFARRKMITYNGMYARATLAPAAIATDAYVYLSDGNTTFNRAPFYYNGTLLYEAPPTQFLEDNKDLLYSNGHVKIYK